MEESLKHTADAASEEVASTSASTPTQPPAIAAAPPSAGSRFLTIGIIMAAIALALFWVKQDNAKNAAKGSTVGKPSAVKVGDVAPRLVLKDLQGKTVSLEDLKGKVVIVDFWATWCEPCQVMIPWLVEFRNRYASRGFEIVGVAMDDDGVASVKPFVEKEQMNYPVLLGTDAAAEDWGGVFGLPTSFMIDREGKIRFSHQGLVGKDIIEKDIRSLL